MKPLLCIAMAGTLGFGLASVSHAQTLEELFVDGESRGQTPASLNTSDFLTDDDSGLTADVDGSDRGNGSGSRAPISPEQEAPNISAMDDHTESLVIENEVTEIDKLAYDDVATEASSEAKELQRQIGKLEKQIKKTKSGAERSKKNAELAQKRLALKTQLKKDANKRLAQVERLKRQHDQKLAALRARVKGTEARVSATQLKTKELNKGLKAMQREKKDLERRLRKATARLAREKARQKALRDKRAKEMRETRRLKSQVAVAEKRAG